MALIIENKVESACRRGDLFAKRRNPSFDYDDNNSRKNRQIDIFCALYGTTDLLFCSQIIVLNQAMVFWACPGCDEIPSAS